MLKVSVYRNFLALICVIFLSENICARQIGKRAAQAVRNLRARYDTSDASIYVEWEPIAQESSYTLRYKVNRKSSNYGETNDNWQFARSEGYGSGETQFARLSANNLDNNDELLVQVKPNSGTEWSDTLLISIAKRSEGADGLFAAAAEAELSPPLNFTANILAPDAIRLEWTRSASEARLPGLYYIVDVRQTTTNNPTASAPPIYKQIKVESDNFLLGDLTSGEHYEMTIRSATSPDHVSSTAAIVEITLPKSEEFFEVGNLIISSRFKSDGSGTVNLTWEIPQTLVGKIVSYDVQYAAKNNGIEQWHRILFPGNAPTVLLHNLKSDTEYLLKIKTVLANGVETESGEFKFRTPRVPANPIQKVDVIYSSETSAIRLQWILASHVLQSNVAGYDIFLSEDKNEAEERWRFIPLNSEDSEISLDDLRRSTTYFVKIKVRLMDGTILNSPLIYKFTTIDGVPEGGLESRMPDTLSYSNVGTGRVSLTWSYPQSVLADIRGAKIFYTNQPNAPIQLWQKINIDTVDQKSVILAGLRENTIYFVQIVPVLYTGALDFHNAENLQLRTE